MTNRLTAAVVLLLCVAVLASAAATYDSVDAAGGFDVPVGSPVEPGEAHEESAVAEETGGESGVQPPMLLPDLEPGAFESGHAEPSSSGLLTVVAVLVTAVCGLLAVAYYVSGGAGDSLEKRPTDDDSSDEGGAAPGTLPAPEPSNEVARAWWTLAHPLERPRYRTPGEVARRAVDRGLEPRVVEELTALFRSTRYGPEEPTEDDERKARELADRLDRGGDDP